MTLIESVTMPLSAAFPRRETDTLFELPHTHYTYEGVIMDTVRFIQEKQLLDAKSWALFVNQYRSDPDTHDRGWRCEYWGKMMRGACFTYECTKDETLYATLEATVRDLLTTQDALGRFSTYSPEAEFSGWDVWGRKYILLGLEYFYELCRDDALRADIMTAMCRHADYILSRVGDEEGQIPITMTSDQWGGVNACSILEPFVRLHNMTDEQRYLDFAGHIVELGGTNGGNMIDVAIENIRLPHEFYTNKAYETMSFFEGVLEFYRATGDERCYTAAVNYANKVIENEVTVIGSAGCMGEQFNHAALMQYSTKIEDIMQETCVSVTLLKLCAAMLALTGYARYADVMECAAFNAIRGAVNTEWKPMMNGVALPFDSYTPSRAGVRGRAIGGCKTMENDTFYGCCACIGSAGAALYTKYAVMASDTGLHVNFYQSGTVKTEAPDGSPLTLTMDTAYPLDETIRITVTGESDTPCTLAFRIPAWSQTVTFTCGSDKLFAFPGTYAAVERAWNGTTEIILTLDMRTRLTHATALPDDPDAAFQFSLRRGPIVLSRDARFGDDVDSPVRIPTDKDGYIDGVTVIDAPFDALLSLSIPTEDGTLPVCDCGSAGKTLDERSRMAIWMNERH